MQVALDSAAAKLSGEFDARLKTVEEKEHALSAAVAQVQSQSSGALSSNNKNAQHE